MFLYLLIVRETTKVFFQEFRWEEFECVSKAVRASIFVRYCRNEMLMFSC